ncbi:hypothetical protein MMC07_008446 [Pseudocyphellaria aurata]|nr:hypothetical protein [Pseudocyphellaria aurata]
MPSFSSDVAQQPFFTMDKLRLFQNYSVCVEDAIYIIIFELRQLGCDRARYEELSRTLCDKVTELVGEIRYMTEECVLPPCTPEEAEKLNEKREELRESAKMLSDQVAFFQWLAVVDGHFGSASNAPAELESNLDNELARLGRREAYLRQRLAALEE